jgi:2-hydroxychromene-2-carboxylate isomerase/predicted thioesterase
VKPTVLSCSATHRDVPGSDSTAAAIGNTGVVVVSSPYMIGLLEEASHRAVKDFYEPGEATVGTRIDVSHLAPAFPGREIVAQAKLEVNEGRRLKFSVSAYQGDRLIMQGSHERALVRLESFLESEPGVMNTTKRPIEFFFDYHSPWCYFAALRMGALAARVAREVVWKPMHLARLIERIDGRRPLDANPAFVQWFKSDMQDWASALGVEVRYHPSFPLRPVRALRATVYAAEQGLAEAFVIGVMRAYWSESKDISDPLQLAEVGKAIGLDAGRVLASIDDPAYKNAVEVNTKEAQDRGVFGAPSFFCDGKLFWGNDRMGQLEEFANTDKKQSAAGTL